MTDAERRYLDAVALVARVEAAERLGIEWRTDEPAPVHTVEDKPDIDDGPDDPLMSALEVSANLRDSWLGIKPSASTLSRWRTKQCGKGKWTFFPDYDEGTKWKASTIDRWLATLRELNIKSFDEWKLQRYPQVW